MKTIRLLPFLFVAGVSSLAACSSTSGDDTTGAGGSTGAGAVKLAANVTIIEGAAADGVAVEATRLVFPAGSPVTSAPVGQVLVGDRQSKAGGKNPDGFLRKVVSVSTTSEGVVVQTEDAVLTDAVEEGSFQVTLTTPDLGNDGPAAQTASLAKGPGYQPMGGGKPIKLLDFSGTKLFDWPADVTVQTTPPKTIGFDAFASVKTGTLTFTPTWDLGADIKGFSLNSFHASATGKLDATVVIETGVTLKTNLTPEEFTKLVAQQIAKTHSATLFDYPVDLGTFKLGPLPMPVKADFSAVLACDFKWGGGLKVDYGGTASGTVTVNLKYDAQNGLSADYDKSASFKTIGPTYTMDGNAHVRCELTPQFSLNLFGLAFAEVWVKPYVDMGANLTCTADKPPQGHAHGEAFVGVSAGAHAKAKVLGFKWEKACTLFAYESDHATFDELMTLPGGQDAQCVAVTFPVTPPPVANPEACLGGGSGQQGQPDAGGAKDAGALSCTHAVCVAGDALSAGCDKCTKAVCDKDPYCCEQHWGPSCFLDVETYCGHKCQ